MIALTFTYDRDVVELIKVCVPNYARSWSSVRREWLIEDVHGKAATKYRTVTLLALIGTRASNRAARAGSDQVGGAGFSNRSNRYRSTSSMIFSAWVWLRLRRESSKSWTSSPSSIAPMGGA